MKIQANEVQIGQEISFGWGQWLKVEKIVEDEQKNGKKLLRFYGSSKQEKPTRRGARRYPTIEAKANDECYYKELTKVTVR